MWEWIIVLVIIGGLLSVGALIGWWLRGRFDLW